MPFSYVPPKKTEEQKLQEQLNKKKSELTGFNGPESKLNKYEIGTKDYNDAAAAAKILREQIRVLESKLAESKKAKVQDALQRAKDSGNTDEVTRRQEELDAINQQMLEALHAAGMQIDLVLAATEFKNGTAQRRKPNIRMGLEAKELIPSIDFSRSIMIGDTNTDILFGKRLGMFTILVESEERVKEVADLRLPHLAHLSTYL